MITAEQSVKARKLIAILRDPTRWPKGFKWHYDSYMGSDGCGCAMPLAVHAGLAEDDEVDYMALAFGMPLDRATIIFACAHRYLGKLIEEVTAEDVAGLIEKWSDAQTVSA